MTAIPYETSPRKLALTCAGALGAALLILVLFVLPAERGIDLTGLGSVLGLTQMRDGGTAVEEAAVRQTPSDASSVAASPQTKQTIAKSTPLRSDEMTVVLRPHAGAEIKARMQAGDHLIFRWEASGPVKADMHGERPNAGEAFTRYWKENDQASGQGAFTAPFSGAHGWYWRNRGETDVTIRVRTNGFYETLFQPPQD